MIYTGATSDIQQGEAESDIILARWKEMERWMKKISKNGINNQKIILQTKAVAYLDTIAPTKSHEVDAQECLGKVEGILYTCVPTRLQSRGTS